MRTRTVPTVVITLVAALILTTVGALAFIYSGEYNVAATKAHYRPVAWALETTMHRSVRDHASEISPPPPVDSTQLLAGFHHFEAMCVTCHGAPGQERSEIGKGLLPEPPALSEAVPDWTPAELFWIVKHGIKMSGMPAFGLTHDDQQIWGIVAFLRRLPGMTPQQYEAYRAEDGSATHSAHGYGHERTRGGEAGHTHRGGGGHSH